ncbi:MAG: acyl carrier protein, partial [Candidatus Brocadiae bacterium]|nr:acyl carrier protein [Candidatus Brocadiia bacterium]
MKRSRRAGPAEELSADAAALIGLVETLVKELRPGAGPVPVTLDSGLATDLGIDSLARVEMLLRIEREFRVAVPDQAGQAAETLRDLLRAIEERLKIREIQAARGRNHQPTAAELEEHELSDDAWQQAAQRFFDQEQDRGSNYQRLRSGGVDAQEEAAWAPIFKDQAQLEDLVHMLINMMGIERTE